MVTNGMQTASLNLIGDFVSFVFTAASDGHGGTAVTEYHGLPPGPPPAAPFIEAMASFAPASAGAFHAADDWRPRDQPLLVGPRMMQTA